MHCGTPPKDDAATSRWTRWQLPAAAVAVFVAAVLVRLPACTESFWADELHSAWTVWNGVDAVAKRAAAGNQTPLYFWGLWLWKQMVGSSEVALRFSSVLAMSAAAAVLVVGVARQTRQLASGILAGGILAIEPNAIFFGTELRPYAVVVLCAAVVCVLFAKILSERDDALDSERDADVRGAGGRRGRPAAVWIVMVAVACLAVLLQPTAAAALFPLAGAAGAVLLWRSRRTARSISAVQWGIVACLLAATAFSLAQSAAMDAWAARANWRAFASSHHWQQMWTVWPWKPLVVWPGIFAGLVAAFCGRRIANGRSAWPWLLGFAVIITIATWIAARGGWIPLWHRRYMISVLPMLAWISGVLWGTAVAAVRTRTRRPTGWLGQSVAVAAVLVLLTWNLGLLDQLWAGQTRFVRRHEGWREAVQWVESQRQPSDPIWVAAELIESRELLPGYQESAVDRNRREYLNYVVNGPYHLAATKPIGPLRFSLARELQALLDSSDGDRRRRGNSVWILARYSASRLQPILQQSIARDAAVQRAVQRSRIRRFGTISAVELQLSPPEPLPAGGSSGL